MDEAQGRENKPVRMFWKASSTLLASSAEVSMNERLLSPTPPSGYPSTTSTIES